VQNDNKNYIANIYQKATIINNIITFENDITSQLCKNDIIKIILDKNNSSSSVLEKYNNINVKIIDIISPTEILIETSLNAKTIFVYGKLVNDFHTLNYNSIFSLNVEMTHQLYKSNISKMREINDLTSKINNNNNLINTYKTITSNLFEKIALLEAKII
jgi:hypothetical protein